MLQTPPSAPTRPPMTVASCLVTVVALLLILAALSGFVLFFVKFILPRIPERVVPHPERYAGVGRQINYLELEPLTGDASKLSLEDLDENVVLMNFWGTWCSPCRTELPAIAALRQRFAGHEGFRLIAVSYPALGQHDDVESLRENTEALLKRLNLDLPTYWDPDNTTRLMLDRLVPDAEEPTYGTPLFPVTILLGRYGTIRAVWIGYRPGMETEVERFVDQVLTEERSNMP